MFSIKRLVFFFAFVIYLYNVMAQDFTQYVDPRIGTVGLGRTFPGPSMPFGMVKPGPDCINMPNAGWAPIPEKVVGFSQTHVSGTGGGQKYGNILIQPCLKSQELNENIIPQRRIGETIDLGYYACTYILNMADWWLMLLGSWVEILFATSERLNSLKAHISKWFRRKVLKDGAVCVEDGTMAMPIPFIFLCFRMYLSR